MNKKRSFKVRFFKGLWSITWKLILIFISLVVISGIYFDKKIERRLDGATWTLPAALYARPLLMQVNTMLTAHALISELKLLNYRPVEDVYSAGQFSVKGQQVTIYRRAFDFPERAEAEALVRISFDRGIISRIENEQLEQLYQFTLDPLLLDRLKSDTVEDRVFIPFEKIPNLFIDTLLLMEDRDFYHHQGVSPFAIVRAFVANFKAGHTV